MNDDEGAYGPRYPARRLLDLVGDKWTPVVLYCLADEPRRYSALQRAIPDISKKVLTQVLRALEAGGVVQRTVFPTVPPATEYRLTALGRELHAPVAALCNWASANEHLLDAIHARLRAARGGHAPPPG